MQKANRKQTKSNKHNEWHRVWINIRKDETDLKHKRIWNSNKSENEFAIRKKRIPNKYCCQFIEG